jgi:metal-responsive CopG/Arc/MetJ family transcriptional regulator
MKTFSVRIDDELFDKVEAERGDKARTDFIREVIEGYFVTKVSPELNQNSPEQVKHIESLQSEISFLREQVKDLDRLLSQEQSLHLQTQKQIMPGQEEIAKKAWWQFWKK